MRWVILTDDYPPQRGGVATWTAAIVSGLRHAGDEVEVFARAREGLVGATGVRGPSFGRWGGAWHFATAWRRLLAADAILATTWPVATWVSRVPPLAAKLHVVAHGSDVTRPTWSSRARQRVLARAAFRWTVSGYLREHMARWGLHSVTLPAPIDVVDAGPPSSDLRRLVGVGRAIETKGGERFVRLVAALGCRGTWVGDGPCLAAWRELARRLEADVTFLGEQPQSACMEALRAADLAVLLPRSFPDGSGQEGLGLVLLEASSCGTPSVGCQVGGVPEALGPGLLVLDPDDAPATAERVRAWWSPARGQEARDWLEATHGVGRVVQRLQGADRC